MLGKHDRAILQFSGGKDSAALLWLARPYLDRIEVCHVDSGGAVPHVREYVDDMADRLGIELTVIRPPVPVMEHTERFGLPADVVPAWNVPGFALAGRQPLQAPVACCNAVLWQPMAEHVRQSGATLVLRGVKSADARKGVPPGHVEDGVEYAAPLWDWTDADVMSYLEKEGVPLPFHYPEVNDGLDCWGCTAYLATPYGAGKLRLIRDHYPELWPTLADRLDRMQRAVSGEWANVTRAIDGVLA
jgi:3'-phosphoadenosine 5'-phosphosulfate sulfotransferase (PAPS reductase)/FAD synthetase